MTPNQTTSLPTASHRTVSHRTVSHRATRRHDRSRRFSGAALLVASIVAAATLLAGGTAGAQDATDSPDQQATTTVVVGDVGPASDCSPGHIVRRPDCGIPPQSPTDPGGWLQVSLFYLICFAVVAILGGVWWRSRKLRDQRRAAGLDPLTLAKAKGQGTRRSTRSEPVAATSSNTPEANAGK